MTDYIVDEFGVQYSKDGLRLLKATRNLTNYFVKKNAIEICKEAFKFNTLESIVISESVVIIGELAFANCDNLQYIHLPNTLENIKDRAFVGCTNLRRIYLPLSLKVIGKNPFEGCKSITFINRSINFTVDDNVLFDKNKHTIISFASKKRHYNIPNTVLKIKALTFASCSLDYLNLPASITDIEDEAFFSTSINHINNESIHFTIEDNVLFNKSKQKLIYSFNSHENYEVPDSVTIIANSAFAYSFLLNSIKIPDSVKIIGDTAF